MKRGQKRVVNIGMLINMAVKPSRDLLMGVEQCIWARPGLRLKFFLGSAATTTENIKKFVSSGVDALIFCGLRRDIVFKYIKAAPKHPPIVLLTYSPLSEDEWDCLGNGGAVMLDNEQIGKRAADFFLSHGLKNFAFLGRNGDRDDIFGRIRGTAFKQRLFDQLGEQMVFKRMIVGEFRPNEDYWETEDREVLENWATELPKPCGVLVNGDHLAYKLLETCRKLEIAVPGDIEILGLNNNDGYCERALPSISFIFPDIDACAKEAVGMAMQLMRGIELSREERFVKVSSNSLSERGSTAKGRGYGRIAVRASEFIRMNACKGIMVSDVSRHLGISRRTLEVRVREATGSSVLGLIRDVRMAEVCRLLTTTNMSISEVTLRSGYQLTTNLGVTFKKRYGMTMRTYRALHSRNI